MVLVDEAGAEQVTAELADRCCGGKVNLATLIRTNPELSQVPNI